MESTAKTSLKTNSKFGFFFKKKGLFFINYSKTIKSDCLHKWIRIALIIPRHVCPQKIYAQQCPKCPVSSCVMSEKNQESHRASKICPVPHNSNTVPIWSVFVKIFYSRKFKPHIFQTVLIICSNKNVTLSRIVHGNGQSHCSEGSKSQFFVIVVVLIEHSVRK